MHICTVRVYIVTEVWYILLCNLRLYSITHAALLSRVASRKGDELQIPTKSDLEQINERNLSLNTAVPTVVVTNTVASGRDTPAVTVAILPTLQTLLPSNPSG